MQVTEPLLDIFHDELGVIGVPSGKPVMFGLLKPLLGQVNLVQALPDQLLPSWFVVLFLVCQCQQVQRPVQMQHQVGLSPQVTVEETLALLRGISIARA